jgi:uncharacterized membrane protein YphA (DoxX/SURF4 family)
VGLFLLRGAIGLVALIQGGYYLTDGTHSSLETWLGLFGIVAGASLLAGFVTPIAGVVVGLGALGAGFSVLPAWAANLFDAKLSLIFAGIMAAGIVFLGPGAFSVDARLFGRREIIIPPPLRRPEQ